MSLPQYPQLRDPQRLAAIARLGLDREEPRPFLDELVQGVAARIGTPFALVTVLLNDAQVFLAGTGPIPEWIAGIGGTPIEWAFCCPLLRERAPRIVNDFTADPEFCDNPLVTVEGVRAYIGAPLISGGNVLGAVCGLDVQPRDSRPEDLRYLEERAGEVVRRLEEQARGAFGEAA